MPCRWEGPKGAGRTQGITVCASEGSLPLLLLCCRRKYFKLHAHEYNARKKEIVKVT